MLSITITVPSITIAIQIFKSIPIIIILPSIASISFVTFYYFVPAS